MSELIKKASDVALPLEAQVQQARQDQEEKDKQKLYSERGEEVEATSSTRGRFKPAPRLCEIKRSCHYSLGKECGMKGCRLRHIAAFATNVVVRKRQRVGVDCHRMVPMLSNKTIIQR